MGHELLSIELGSLYTFRLCHCRAVRGQLLLRFAEVLKGSANHFQKGLIDLPLYVTAHAQFQMPTPLSYLKSIAEMQTVDCEIRQGLL